MEPGKSREQRGQQAFHELASYCAVSDCDRRSVSLLKDRPAAGFRALEGIVRVKSWLHHFLCFLIS